MTATVPAHLVADGAERIPLTTGRAVGIRVYAPPIGLPILFFHGSPDSRLGARLLEEAATRVGVHILGLDRPGIGHSDPAPRRRIIDWPTDVGHVLDTLGLDRVGLLGVSAGAAYVYACCRAWPDRVAAAGVVSGVGPPEFLTGMRPTFVRASLRIPGLGRAMFGSVASGARRDPERYLVPGLVPADIQALEGPGVHEAWIAGLLEAYRSGPDGVVLDQALQLAKWGFSLRDIDMPIRLWHGGSDRVVPISVARRVAAALPAGRLTELPGEGHLSSLVHHAGEILEAMVTAAAP